MPKRRYLLLTAPQRAELEDVRDHAAKPHLREKAAVLLKIADGLSAHRAAQVAGLKPHQPRTIYQWLDWYEADGVAALQVQPGRGRKPAFSPSARDGGGRQGSVAGGGAPTAGAVRV